MVVTSTGASTFSSFFCLLLICSAASLTASPASLSLFSLRLLSSLFLVGVFLASAFFRRRPSFVGLLAPSLPAFGVRCRRLLPRSWPASAMCSTVVGMLSRAGQHAGDARGKFAVRAVVDREQQALEIGHEAASLPSPRVRAAAFPPCASECAPAPSAASAASPSVVDHRHGDDHGEKVLVERAHRQADGGDDDLGRAARIHAASERKALAPGQAAEFAADEGAAEFADAGDHDEADGEQGDLAGRRGW